MTAAKFWVALSAALGVAVSVTVDGVFSVNDGLAVAAAFVGAVAVYAVPNGEG
jgi:hypothetical protein